MIKRKENMSVAVRENMRGGDGSVIITDILNSDEYKGKCRLLGVITLEPGCSIGEHIHENEEEVFYIIEGTATYNDNGEIKTLNEGDSCVCLGGEKHSIANKTDSVVRVFAVILTY